MPRLHFVKSARKPQKEHGIKKGDSYWWWAFRVGRGSIKRVSKTRPRRSQLTLSEFYGSVWDAEDSVTDALGAFQGIDSPTEDDFENLASEVESAADTMQEIGENCDEKFNNMPDGLQQGDTGQLLETRRDRCSELADELRNAADNIRSASDEGDDRKDIATSEVEGISWECE